MKTPRVKWVVCKPALIIVITVLKRGTLAVNRIDHDADKLSFATVPGY